MTGIPTPSVRADFNPHSRKGSDANVDFDFSSYGLISIHTPARGVTGQYNSFGKYKYNFNPHSRKGSDEDCTIVCQLLTWISIHTPARGVTMEGLDIVRLQEFQSTLPQGE